MDNINCEWMFYEPNECKKCLLLGYHYSCGSQECKKARENSYGKSIKTNALYGGGNSCCSNCSMDGREIVNG